MTVVALDTVDDVLARVRAGELDQAAAIARLRGSAAVPGAVVVASAPVAPPAAWFENPHLAELTPLEVDEDGRIFGHAAGWPNDTDPACHTGSAPGVCVTAPHSECDYRHFHLGAVHCDDGSSVAVGQITLNTDHAGTGRDISPGTAQAHYAHTGLAVADVAVGEDEYGIWVAGALRPEVTDEQIRTLRASKLSGDWRRIGGNLELIALLAVNTPGFPIARVASGEQIALVAALGPVEAACACGSHDLADRLASVERQLAAVKKLAVFRMELDARRDPDPLDALRRLAARLNA